ncbi:hypothetical protein AAG747_08065 [Rapidithrix thailandica]|uniref:Glycine zipper 2TM domain-containing protein n=1 Tax=Rapidithrix thailandica TaxID=413964 RepID=A0AAW9S613_9BACT
MCPDKEPERLLLMVAGLAGGLAGHHIAQHTEFKTAPIWGSFTGAVLAYWLLSKPEEKEADP